MPCFQTENWVGNGGKYAKWAPRARYWGATMTYHYTKKILLVKELLSYKRIENTMKYTHLVKHKNPDFDVETATTVDQAKDLLKVGFDYITEKDNIMLFRRPKRFGNIRVTTEI